MDDWSAEYLRALLNALLEPLDMLSKLKPVETIRTGWLYWKSSRFYLQVLSGIITACSKVCRWAFYLLTVLRIMKRKNW